MPTLDVTKPIQAQGADAPPTPARLLGELAGSDYPLVVAIQLPEREIVHQFSRNGLSCKDLRATWKLRNAPERVTRYLNLLEGDVSHFGDLHRSFHNTLRAAEVCSICAVARVAITFEDGHPVAVELIKP